jgi:hypothetical protein
MTGPALRMSRVRFALHNAEPGKSGSQSILPKWLANRGIHPVLQETHG